MENALSGGYRAKHPGIDSIATPHRFPRDRNPRGKTSSRSSPTRRVPRPRQGALKPANPLANVLSAIEQQRFEMIAEELGQAVIQIGRASCRERV